jgi:hypothetical protein
MKRFDHEPVRGTNNRLAAEGFVEFVGSQHEADILLAGLELLVLEQKRQRLLGTPSPIHYPAEDLLESIRLASFEHEDERPKPKLNLLDI